MLLRSYANKHRLVLLRDCSELSHAGTRAACSWGWGWGWGWRVQAAPRAPEPSSECSPGALENGTESWALALGGDTQFSLCVCVRERDASGFRGTLTCCGSGPWETSPGVPGAGEGAAVDSGSNKRGEASRELGDGAAILLFKNAHLKIFLNILN